MNKYEHYLKELLKNVNFTSILIINKKGQLKRIYCPFSVKTRTELPHIQKGDVVIVERIAITENLKDVFIINNKAYYTIYFIVLV